MNYVEAYDLLQHMQWNKQQIQPRSPYQWVADTIEDLFAPSESPEDSNSDSETGSEPEISEPEDPLDDPPDQQPEISLKLTRGELHKGFKLWTELTATTPSGRHLGHYKVLVQDDNIAYYFLLQMELPL